MTQKSPRLLQSGLLVMSLMVIVKLVGFVREIAIGYFYGATAETDVFFLATSVVLSAITTLSNAINTSTVPLFAHARAERAKQKKALASVLDVTLLAGIILSALICLSANGLAGIMAPEYSAANKQQLADFMRILGVGAAFALCTACLSGQLNALERFSGPQMTGAVLSVTVIAFSAAFSKTMGVWALVLAYPVSHFLQALMLGLFTRPHVPVSLTLRPDKAILRRFITASLPLLIGNAVIVLNNAVDMLLAAQLPSSTVSTLTYAQTLSTVLNALLISSLVTVGYTRFCNLTEQGYMDELRSTVRYMSSLLLLLLAPVTAAVFIMGGEAVQIIYLRGAFTAQAAAETATLFKLYATLFVFTGITEVMRALLLSQKKENTVMVIGIINVATNIGFSILLSRFWGAYGIVLGTTASAVIAVIMMSLAARKYVGKLGLRAMAASFGKITLCVLCTSAVTAAVHYFLPLTAALPRFIICAAVFVAAYVLFLKLFKCAEFNSLISELKGMLRAKRGGGDAGAQ